MLDMKGMSSLPSTVRSLQSKPELRGLHNKTLALLDTPWDSPLAQLQSNNVIHDEVLSAVVGAMVFIIAVD